MEVEDRRTFKNTEKDFHFQPYDAPDILENPPAKNHLSEYNRAKTLCSYVSTTREKKKAKGRHGEKEAKNENCKPNISYY